MCDPFFEFTIKTILDMSGHRNRYTLIHIDHIEEPRYSYSDLSAPVLSHPPRVSSPHQDTSNESDSESTTVAENSMKALVSESKVHRNKVKRTKSGRQNNDRIHGHQTRVCLRRRVWIWVLACERDAFSFGFKIKIILRMSGHMSEQTHTRVYVYVDNILRDLVA